MRTETVLTENDIPISVEKEYLEDGEIIYNITIQEREIVVSEEEWRTINDFILNSMQFINDNY